MSADSFPDVNNFEEAFQTAPAGHLLSSGSSNNMSRENDGSFGFGAAEAASRPASNQSFNSIPNVAGTLPGMALLPSNNSSQSVGDGGSRAVTNGLRNSSANRFSQRAPSFQRGGKSGKRRPSMSSNGSEDAEISSDPFRYIQEEEDGVLTNHVNGNGPTNHFTGGMLPNHVNGDGPTNHINGPTNHFNGDGPTNHFDGNGPTNQFNGGMPTNHVNGGVPTNHFNGGVPTNHANGDANRANGSAFGAAVPSSFGRSSQPRNTNGRQRTRRTASATSQPAFGSASGAASRPPSFSSAPGVSIYDNNAYQELVDQVAAYRQKVEDTDNNMTYWHHMHLRDLQRQLLPMLIAIVGQRIQDKQNAVAIASENVDEGRAFSQERMAEEIDALLEYRDNLNRELATLASFQQELFGFARPVKDMSGPEALSAAIRMMVIFNYLHPTLLSPPR